MARRLFIAITIPADILKGVSKAAEKIKLPPGVRILKQDGWHVTVLFLGNQDDSAISGIISAMGETAAGFEAPEIILEKFSYGPPGKKPRMLWLETDGRTSERLSKIKDFLEDKMADNGVGFQRENRKFNGHVTLARFGESNGPVVPIIAKAGWGFTPTPKNLVWGFTAPKLELFESVLKKSGAEYTKLSSFDFS